VSYDHTQKAPLYWILLGGAIFGGVITYSVSDQSPAFWIALGVTVVIGVIAACFVDLTVRDEGDCLSVRFGPIPIFGTRICFSDMHNVEASRSSVVDGWGVHWIPGRGWTYNIWGFGCVKITLGNKVVRIGTDDIDGLLKFLKTKVNLPD
jgi:hypothetical protein